jgi:hypothetical protein
LKCSPNRRIRDQRDSRDDLWKFLGNSLGIYRLPESLFFTSL